MDQPKIESSHDENGFHIIRLNGPFTIQELFEFQDLYRGTTDLVTLIDLTNVPYMDSAALGAIVTVHMTSQRHKRHYALIGVSERLRSLFNVVGVDGLLVTCLTIEEAQQKFASNSAAET